LESVIIRMAESDVKTPTQNHINSIIAANTPESWIIFYGTVMLKIVLR